LDTYRIVAGGPVVPVRVVILMGSICQQGTCGSGRVYVTYKTRGRTAKASIPAAVLIVLMVRVELSRGSAGPGHQTLIDGCGVRRVGQLVGHAQRAEDCSRPVMVWLAARGLVVWGQLLPRSAGREPPGADGSAGFVTQVSKVVLFTRLGCDLRDPASQGCGHRPGNRAWARAGSRDRNTVGPAVSRVVGIPGSYTHNHRDGTILVLHMRLRNCMSVKEPWSKPKCPTL
jgi:hypothetical protein